MEKVIAWLRASAILRQQVALIVVTVLGLFGQSLDFDLNQTLEKVTDAVVALLVVLLPVWTIVTRIRKPAPNLSAAAKKTEVRLVEQGKIPVEKASVEAASAASTSVSEQVKP